MLLKASAAIGGGASGKGEEEEEEVVVASQAALLRGPGAAPRLANGGGLRGASGAAAGLTPQERHCWRRFSLVMGVGGVAGALLLLCVWPQAVASARDATTGTVAEHSFPYYVLCFVGGGLAGLGHVVVTPIDVVKCRMQVGACGSMTEGFAAILAEARGSYARALPMLYRGWWPTFLAYVIQGALKFSLYEILKHALSTAWRSTEGPPQDGTDSGSGAVLVVYLFSSAVAEMVADVGLAPFETVKIKVQTTNLSSTSVSTIMPRVWATEGWRGFYKGLVPLWFRQVPYTMVKFASFERIVRVLHALLLSSPDPATAPPSPAAELAVTLLAGVLAGILCALVSHPADTLVSKISQLGARGGAGSLTSLLMELGCGGLWRGLLPRLAMVSSITALQWLIYDTFKVAVGLPTTGGGSAAHRATAVNRMRE